MSGTFINEAAQYKVQSPNHNFFSGKEHLRNKESQDAYVATYFSKKWSTGEFLHYEKCLEAL